LADAQTECFGMASLVQWLDKRIKQATDGTLADPEDNSQLRLESDSELVRICTVHKAKGLEYPIVLLPFALWLGTMGQPQVAPLRYHAADDSGRKHTVINFSDADRDAADQALLEAESEALRLLYVAL